MQLVSKGLFKKNTSGGGHRSIELRSVKPGINSDEEVFFGLDDSGKVSWVVSRVCDHSNGKLRLNPDGKSATCPLHNWRLSLESLKYENVQLKKECVPFHQEGMILTYEIPRATLDLPEVLFEKKSAEVSVRFLAHACIEIRVAGLSIVTDPWILGPCFTTGWWHSAIPPSDALEIVRNADAIYLSHNHPDHLHPETLKAVPRDTVLLIPPFESQSVEKIVRELGFTRIHILSFGEIFEIDDTKVYISILPSGDFRDDSGLYLTHGDFSALCAVDANRLNQYILPQNPTLLLSTFASGATGYPLCFEMYSDAEKEVMLARNCRGDMSNAEKYIRATRPLAFIPYAGYFTEAAQRDRYIKEHNRKNSPAFAKSHLEARFPDVAIINPVESDRLLWRKGALTADRSDVTPLFVQDESYIAHWIEKIDRPWDEIEDEGIVRYFRRASYRDDLKLFLVPTDDDFHPSAERSGFVIDFRAETPLIETMFAIEADALYDALSASHGKDSCRLKRIRVRLASLSQVIKNGLPWEDLSIGFQCRIHRTPDVYNSNFWYYFTNEYIGGGVALERSEVETPLSSDDVIA